jgi:hypothetical protein
VRECSATATQCGPTKAVEIEYLTGEVYIT